MLECHAKILWEEDHWDPTDAQEAGNVGAECQLGPVRGGMESGDIGLVCIHVPQVQSADKDMIPGDSSARPTESCRIFQIQTEGPNVQGGTSKMVHLGPWDP